MVSELHYILSPRFGMPYIDRNGSDRYKFGGKEYDATGGLNLYDFEARMYDAALARFMSPDPMSDQYPSVSPYAYCANNPVGNIDPSGMIIVSEIMGREFKLEKQKSGTYQFLDHGVRKVLDIAGMDLEIAINTIVTAPIGKEIVDKCIDAKDGVKILITDKGNGYSDKTSTDDYNTLKWNNVKTTGGIHDVTDKTTIERPPYIGLGHELAHFYDKINKTVDNTVWFKYEGFTVYNDEKFACKIENQLRDAFKIPLRTHYLTIKDKETGKYRGYEPSRLK